MTFTELRAERNQRLAASDYLMLADNFGAFSEGDKTIVTTYRQALRDLPSAYTEGEQSRPSSGPPNLSQQLRRPKRCQLTFCMASKLSN